MGFSRGPKVVTDGLLLYLDAANVKSYPGSGTTWNDLSANSNTGTLLNGPTFVDGNGGSVQFDGVNDYVSSISIPYPTTWSDPFTLEVWLKVDTGITWYKSGSGTNILGRGSYGGSIGIFRSSVDNQVIFWVRTSSNIFSISTMVSRDIFHNIVGVWDGIDTARIYNNGELINSTTSTNISGAPNGGSYLTMGNIAFGGTNGGYGAGNLSISKVYNRALTSQEVLQNFNATKSRYGL